MLLKSLIHEIELLPVEKRFCIIEQTLPSIKNYERDNQQKLVVEKRYGDYKTHKELTVFEKADLLI
jgi:hypothetical protein